MPPISLDNQVFFDSNQLKIPNIQHQKPDIVCENARVPQPQPATPSNDDAIVISSDDESDDEDSASVRSSSSLPPVDQLLADMRDCGNVGIDERGMYSFIQRSGTMFLLISFWQRKVPILQTLELVMTNLPKIS
jgi:hypothetical protein